MRISSRPASRPEPWRARWPRLTIRPVSRAKSPAPIARVAPPPPAAGGRILIGHLARDVRYAVRLLRRAPAFAAAAIVTLALGIGANTAIFSVVRAVVLRPPPYRDPSRSSRSSTADPAPGSIYEQLAARLRGLGRQLTSFEGLGLLSGWTFNITGLELPERVFGARVSGSLFPVLGTPPLFGRVIEPADDRPGGERSSSWATRLAAAVRGRPRSSAAPS